MTFDAMATAIDWLDAYRAGELDAVLKLYADDATIECCCGGTKIIGGRDALRAYWEQHLNDYPVSELDDLQPVRDGVAIAYLSSGGFVLATLEFNVEGQISFFQCGPSKREPASGSTLAFIDPRLCGGRHRPST
jgi:ketosteroid isomerase-like protein